MNNATDSTSSRRGFLSASIATGAGLLAVTNNVGNGKAIAQEQAKPALAPLIAPPEKKNSPVLQTLDDQR